MKKKGFTLIELLAVIIILAIVALIATPVVLNLIEKMRIKAAESSAKGYTKAVEYKIMNDGIFDNISYDGEYDVIDNDLNVSYQGDGPSEGVFIVEKNKVTYGEFCINGYPIKYENDYGKYAPGEISCNGQTIFTPPEGTIASELCEGAINYDEVTNINIEKAEDLACISYLSNTQSKTFEGKTLSLISDIDFNDDNSYRDKSTTQIYKDMNGNGIEEDIKTEFTTGKGFKPIGNDSVPFKGTFNGYGYTISNLLINRSGTSYLGLFGYINGSLIEGINLDTVTINGSSYIGGLVGYVENGKILGVNVDGLTYLGSGSTGSYIGGIAGVLKTGEIKEVTVNATFTGYSSIGGVVGRNETEGNKIISAVVNTTINGAGSVGGVFGSSSAKPEIKAVVESGSIVRSYSNDSAGKISTSDYTGTAYASNSVTTNGGRVVRNGKSYELNKHIMGLYDDVLDTYIGGDNDSSGYYLDYENDDSTKVVVKSVKREPLKFKLQGEGTESNPYIIANAKDLKNATLKLKGGYYFKINNDIDFENEKFYMLGTLFNQFDGVLLGNNKNISNVSASGYSAGLVGYLNGGIIKDLNLNNMKSTAAADYAGIVVGTNSGGLVENINIKNATLLGSSYLGGVAGSNTNNGKILGVNVDGLTYLGSGSTGSYIGGIAGVLKTGEIKEVTVNATFTGYSSIGGVVGRNETEGNKIISAVVNTTINGAGSVGGVFGSSSAKPEIKAVVESGSIVRSYSNDSAGKISTSDYTGTAYASNNVTTNGGRVVRNGTAYTLYLPITVVENSEEIDSLSYYNSKGLLDTVIGGDNDNSGYYLDYNNSGDKIIVVPIGGTGGNTNPEEPGTNPTIEIDPNYTMTNIVGTTDTEAPTCELYYVIPVSNGIRASFSCTDNSGAPIVRSLFDSTTEKSAATFDTIGTLKSGSIKDNTKTVISTWNVNNPISQPTPGTCYYFRYGGQDTEGNFSTYVTNICYTGFSN